MDFIAIDFETATGKHSTPCALGITLVKNSQIVEFKSYLINPECKFSPRNIAVHGIRPEDVVSSPTFADLWPEIRPLFRHYPVVAHNVSFDRSVLESTARRYHLDLPAITYFCTLQLCQENYEMESYKLNDLCSSLGICLETHHHCDCDSAACAQIMLHLITDETTAIHDVTQTGERAVQREHRSAGGFYTRISIEAPDDAPFSAPDTPAHEWKLPQLTYADEYSFSGKNTAITGDIPGFEREQVVAYIADQGGVFKSGISKKVDYLIVGLEDRSLISDKETFKSSKIIKCEQLIADGHPVQFISGLQLSERMKNQKG